MHGKVNSGCRGRRVVVAGTMGWLQSLLAPLKKLWIRMHSAQRKSTSRSISPISSRFFFFFLFCDCCVLVCVVACRERDLHPVRGREVVPVRGRADTLVHPRRVLPRRRPSPPPPAAAAAEAVTTTAATATTTMTNSSGPASERRARRSET